jgi:hypothetical protein
MAIEIPSKWFLVLLLGHSHSVAPVEVVGVAFVLLLWVQSRMM